MLRILHRRCEERLAVWQDSAERYRSRLVELRLALDACRRSLQEVMERYQAALRRCDECERCSQEDAR
jgi:translation initiation factor 2 beta subunit (eIF-2beta)/eIF-5